MMVPGRHALPIAALAAALVAGCAKNATSVLVNVTADDDAPPILILKHIVATQDVPTRESSAERSSPYESDAGDRPGPFVFPLLLSLTIDPSLDGLVAITVQGLDWDSHQVIASGTTTGVVVPEHTLAASLTLYRTVSIGGTDGGTD